MKIDFDFSKITISPLLDTLILEDISDDEYFSEKYSDRLSNSRLSLLKNKGAEAFFNGIKSEYSSSFQFGTNLHELVLQPESFELVDSVFKPTAKAGVVADFLYKGDGTTAKDDDIKVASIRCNYYKDKLNPKKILEFKKKAEPYWRDRFIFERKNSNSTKNRIYTDEKSVALLKSCLESLNNNLEIQSLLSPQGLIDTPYVACEKSILIDIKIECEGYDPVIYKWKSKLDNFSLDKEENVITVNDLKTTSKLVNEFNSIIEYYSYHRELAIYSWLLKCCAEKFFNLKNPKVNGNFLVVSTIPEYNTAVYPMTKKLYIKGFKEFTFLLKSVYYLNVIKGYKFN